MARHTFEVYEDNGGGIAMFVLNADGFPVWGHSGYEYTPENLVEDIKALEADDSVSGWEGNGVYDGCLFQTWDEFGKKIEDYYEELSSDEWVDLVADSSGMYLDRMGTAAREALGVREEEEDD